MTNGQKPQHSALPKSNEMYEAFQLCPRLAVAEICIRARQYNAGQFTEICHEHIPSSRISYERILEVLRSLVALLSEWSPIYVINSHLNKRAGKPQIYPGFIYNTTYPEPGAIRQYVRSQNVTAWCDRVIVPNKFREEGSIKANDA